MNAPKLRFKDDDGREFSEWKTVRFGDVAIFSKGKGITKADIAPNGITPCIRYGELYTEYSETIHKIKSKTNIDPIQLQLSEANDVIIPASGETQLDIARAACVLSDGVALGGDLNIIKSNENGVFLSYYLNHQKKLDIAKLSQGNSVVHLYSSQLKLLDLIIPSKPEQTKIANFLTAIDEKISQLTQKCGLLKQYRKGVMQQIFSQKLRFKDEDGREFPEWEEAVIGDVITQKPEKFDPAKSEINFQCIELEHLSQATSELLGYTDALKQKSIKSKFQKGDVLFGKLRPYLRKFLKAPFDGVCSTEIWVLTGKKVSNDFIHQFVQTEDFIALANISSGSKMPRAGWDIVASGTINYPVAKEQTKIANFLTAIDDKITQAQAQLEAVKRYKKGLLQQLFV